MPRGRPRKYKKLPQDLQTTVDNWWPQLLKIIAGQSTVVLPHVCLYPCRLLRTCGKLSLTSLEAPPLVPSLRVLATVPYDQRNQLHHYPEMVLAFVTKIRSEIETLSLESELGKVMRKRGLQKIRLDVIDTGGVRGGGYSRGEAQLLIERALT